MKTGQIGTDTKVSLETRSAEAAAGVVEARARTPDSPEGHQENVLEQCRDAFGEFRALGRNREARSLGRLLHFAGKKSPVRPDQRKP